MAETGEGQRGRSERVLPNEQRVGKSSCCVKAHRRRRSPQPKHATCCRRKSTPMPVSDRPACLHVVTSSDDKQSVLSCRWFRFLLFVIFQIISFFFLSLLSVCVCACVLLFGPAGMVRDMIFNAGSFGVTKDFSHDDLSVLIEYKVQLSLWHCCGCTASPLQLHQLTINGSTILIVLRASRSWLLFVGSFVCLLVCVLSPCETTRTEFER